MSGVIIPDARGGLVWIHGSDGGAVPILVKVDAAGHLQVDILTSLLPTGAATAANQATEIASLALAATAANQATEIADLVLLMKALKSVNTDKIEVEAAALPLPAGAATSALQAGVSTAANQTTEITALQLIDDLRAALAAVATDQLRTDVISYHPHDTLDNHPLDYYARYAEAGSDLNVGDSIVSKNLGVVPAGEVWQIRNAWGIQASRVVNREITAVLSGVQHFVIYEVGVAPSIPTSFNGNLVLAAGDFINVTFFGCVAGDDVYWGASGVKTKIA